MSYTKLLRFAVLLSMVSCAHHYVMRGSVALKVNDKEAHVCLDKDEVKIGDRVTAYYNDCQNKSFGDSRGASSTPCVKTKLGEGKITKILNDHYSLVTFDENVKFSEGTFVEKR